MKQNSLITKGDTWCVIPVFNNKDTVKNIASECRTYLQNVLVVDDGSTDIDVAALFFDTDIKVIKHEKNMGKGRAIRTALDFLKEKNARFMITIDADGQHFPGDIKKFIPLLRDDAILIGCRIFDKKKNVPVSSRFGRKFANFWLQIETGLTIDDCQSGFRAYPVHHISQIVLHGSHYDFETEVLARAAWAGLELIQVEVDVWYPEPDSRVSGFKPFIDNFRISCMHTRLVGRRLVPFPYKKLIIKKEKLIDPWLLLHPVKLLKSLLAENATPGGLAASAAIGIILATLPLIFVHTLVILYVTTSLHLNKIMAISIQNLCIPPFVPMLCIELGYYMRYGNWLTDVSLEIIFGQLPERLFEWFLGSLIIGPILAFIVGTSIFFTSRALQGRTSRYASD